MILEALVSQIDQRFQHEKRAKICLWFDEKTEFGRLIPLLANYLARLSKPPFALLAYDEDKRHGQIWLKHQVHQITTATPATERGALRFVVYVPLSEERLDSPERGDAAPLEMLEEFRSIGVFYKINGKRPTLFNFLKQAGVRLPESPVEQRRLYEGGAESLLGKYSARFFDRPPAFWETTLTPDVAQARLLGDVDQTVFEVAEDPDATWAKLREHGLDRELVAMIKDRYGFEGPEVPSEWIRELVVTVALTETYLAYGEPPDFPLADKLPPLPLRAHHLVLVQRWLRDAKYRPAWDHWVEQVEADIDLAAWAGARNGRSIAFPHLVRHRWRRTWDEFAAASGKESTTEAFFTKTRQLLAEQAEFLKAREDEIGHWQLLRDLDALIAACSAARKEVAAADTSRAFVEIFVKHARTIDGAHIAIRYAAEEAGLPPAATVADRSYAAYTNALNAAFFERIAAAGTLDGLGIPAVTAELEKSLWQAHGKRAVIIVDALRYDCALAIADELRGTKTDVMPLLAMLPTVTPIGMTAMLPLSGALVELALKHNSVHPKVNGKDFAARAERLSYLRDFGADCRDISDVEAATSGPGAGAGELLVVYGHEEVDSIGHGEATTLIRHVRLEIERLARLVRKLLRWDYDEVHIITDHGFILLDEHKLPPEVACDKSWCNVLKERYALVPATADVPLVTLPMPWSSDVRVAVPPGLAFFKAEKSFSHGGAAVQELVIPHLVARGQAGQGKRLTVEVVLPTFELQRAAVKVTVRVGSSAAQRASQMALFAESGRTLSLDVRRRRPDGTVPSVLANKAKEVRIEPTDKESSVTLFFNTALSFSQGELLELDIRDAETSEQFPPGGIKLTVGRDM